MITRSGTMLFFIAVLLTGGIANQSTAGTLRAETVLKNGTTVSIRMVVKRFTPELRKDIRSDGTFWRLADGRVPWGTDGGRPCDFVASAQATWGKREIQVPRWVFEDLCDLNFENWKQGRKRGDMRVSEDQQSVEMYISGSDAGGSYNAVIGMDSTGRFSRHVESGEESVQIPGRPKVPPLREETRGWTSR